MRYRKHRSSFSPAPSEDARLARRLRPDLVAGGYAELGPDRLKSLGRSVLLLDVDGTLAPHGSDAPPAGVSEWIRALGAGGIRCFVVSNAGHKRMARFCGPLGVPWTSNAGKPSPRAVEEALRSLGAEAREAAFLGDQLFTDMACAKRAGVLAVLVRPIPGREPLQIVLKRVLERIVAPRILDPEQRRIWKTGTPSLGTRR
jgi:uncharacterized protein